VTKHRPTRTCLGCRERLPQDELIRLQLKSGKPVLVEHRDSRQPGRSVYFCPKVGCLDKVLRRGEIVFKRSRYDKIKVCLEPQQAARLRFAFTHAARRLRAGLGVGP
jgi:predicted RNA-binding protein YlxR (DUF448 family)